MIAKARNIFLCLSVALLVFSKSEVYGQDQSFSLDTILQTNPVILTQWSPQGNYILSISDEESVISVWSVNTYEIEAILDTGLRAHLVAAEWSPNQEEIVGVSDPGQISIWNVSTNSLELSSLINVDIPTYHWGATATSVAWNVDGTKIAIAKNGVIIWDRGTQEVSSIFSIEDNPLPHEPKHSVIDLQWMSDSQRILTANHSGDIMIVDSDNQTILLISDYLTIARRPFTTAHRELLIGPQFMDVSPDEKKIVNVGDYVWEEEKYAVVIREVETAELVKILLMPEPAYAVAWSPNGKMIAVGTENSEVWIWDADTYEQIAVLDGHEDIVTSVSWSPNNLYLGSGSLDGTIRIWNVNE